MLLPANFGLKLRHNDRGWKIIPFDTMTVRIGENLWLNTGATHYNPQLRLPNKGCAIKELAISSNNAHI